MVLRAYFDASHRPASGLFCVAGYAFSKPRLRAFEEEWSELFAPYGGCHMRELGVRQGRFKGIDDKEALRLMSGAVRAIDRHMSYGVVMSCLLPEFNAMLPKWIKGFEHAYPVCCHLVMSRLGMFLDDNHRSVSVSYVFEQGDDYESSAREFMARTQDTPLLKQSYRHVSHQFVGKPEAIALQAADLLAWEWAKYFDETVIGQKRPMRRSLIALMSKNGEFDERYFGHHLTKESLAKFCGSVADIGLAQLREEADLRHDAAVIREWAAGFPIVKRVWLFGSRVKGTNRDDSDLDVAVEHDALPGEDVSVTAFDRNKWREQMQSNAKLALDVWSYIPGVDTRLDGALAEASRLIYKR